MAVNKNPKSYRKRRVKRIVEITQVAILLFVAIIVGVVGGTLYSVWGFIPNQATIKQYTPTESTKIVSSDGEVLARIYEENREYIPISQIPKNLQHAVVAIEDKRFYEHTGINFRAIARALVENLHRGRLAQGGSTITQQLARNIYLTRRKTMSRKLQEVLLALRIERAYSKEQILELYLNQIYFGSGAYGVQTASQTYFGKKAKDLDLAQCALIAGLPQRPSDYSPYENPDSAERRRNLVLDAMAEQGYITSEQAEEAKNEQIKLVGLKRKPGTRYKAPYFVTYVLKQLINRYGADLIYKGGLVVHSTLNWEMQQAAEKAVRDGLRANAHQNVGQMSLLAMDPQTGAIRAMVGGKDFDRSEFNRATQARRQPGSSFKLFVYTTAIQNGWGPSTTVYDSPAGYPNGTGGMWYPKNSHNQSYGHLSMKRAVALSVNRAAVWTLKQIGVRKVIQTARLMGLQGDLQPYLPLALGASEATLLEMTRAYGIIAAGGEKAEPMGIEKITDRNGEVFEEFTPATQRVLSASTASRMKDCLRAVVTQGTGSRARVIADACGKTGTTQRNVDTWFIGFVPNLVTGVWAGNDSRLPMGRAYGGTVCTPVWTDFMKTAVRVNRKIKEREKQGHQERSRNPNPFEEEPRRLRIPETRPDKPNQDDSTVRAMICDDSGMLATDYCPRTHMETFARGEAPTRKCNVHGASGEAGNGSEQPNTAPSTEHSPTPAPSSNQTSSPNPAPRSDYIELSICATSHKIATDYCPKRITRRYRIDQAPDQVCDVHGGPL